MFLPVTTQYVAMYPGITICLILTEITLSLAHPSCPCTSNVYTLNRDPREATVCQVQATDAYNRSMTWGWNSGPGRWDVCYQHSYPAGSYAIDACYSQYNEGRPCCISYHSERSWSCDRRPIYATPWTIAYNGDSFGFQPSHGGQYAFSINSRNLHYNPWGVVGGSGYVGHITHHHHEELREEVKNCKDTTQERTQMSGWILDRKSTRKCPVVVTSAELVSPMEWNWMTTAGKWKVVYTWGKGGGDKCTVDYTPARGETSRLVSWQFDKDRLTLSYSASPIIVSEEDPWKLAVAGHETCGFTPTTYGSWVFQVYSRNLIIRPFEKPKGAFDLHNQLSSY